MSSKPSVTPRNLTARAAYHVPGNPVISRPEDAVANCYPGLELDVRNFDRRFFPGLVFNFVARNDTGADYVDPLRYGARLAYVDVDEDPDLSGQPDLLAQINDAHSALSDGDWYIDSIEQGGKRISTLEQRADEDGELPMDGLYVWRLVRGIESGSPLTLDLHRRDKKTKPVKLTGLRRRFADAQTGVISLAYQPGELLQSLCSPWQHDFRDCYCHYWASNHPDLVFGELAPREPTLPDGRSAVPGRGTLRLDWLREARSRGMEAAAQDSFVKNRPFQLDGFQINAAWKQLSVVVNDIETSGIYVPPGPEYAKLFASPKDLADELRDKLAPLEMALALEYLYACFSLKSEAEARAAGGEVAADAVVAARHYLMVTAASEMQHLRWVNELLWSLHAEGLIDAPCVPALVPATKIPNGPGQLRDHAFRPLSPETLQSFIEVETPSGTIDGAYMRVIATLRDRRYPPYMQQLAERIAADGMDHESRFRDIQAVFRTLKPEQYLRSLRLADPGEAAVQHAMKLFDGIMTDLHTAYARGAAVDRKDLARDVGAARQKMHDLQVTLDDLAAKGIGVPLVLRR